MAGKSSKAAALPFIGVREGFDLVNKVWGVTGLPTPSSMAQFATRLPQTLPSMIAPTLDVEELDKRIADLRAVEQWLNLNLSMLRTTVQSLEVQRNTIATLKSFGGAMLTGAATTPEAKPANWPYPAGPAVPPMPMPVPEAAAASLATPAPPVQAKPAKGKRSRRGRAAAPGAAAMPLNPAAWWNTLQEQFTKIATTAAAEAQAAATAAAAAEKAEPKTPAPTPRKSRPRKQRHR